MRGKLTMQLQLERTAVWLAQAELSRQLADPCLHCRRGVGALARILAAGLGEVVAPAMPPGLACDSFSSHWAARLQEPCLAGL